MPGKGQSIAAYAAIVFFFIGSLAIGSEANYYIPRFDIYIYHILAWKSCEGSEANIRSTYYITYIGRLPSCQVDVHILFFHFFYELPGAAYQRLEHFSGDQPFIPPYGR